MWILATNLAKSQGQGSEFQGPGLLKPFLCQIWMSVGVLGLILDVGAAVFDRGFGFGAITQLAMWQARIFICVC